LNEQNPSPLFSFACYIHSIFIHA
jgi:hypothetical protein